MPAFVSPLADPATWTYSLGEVTVPAGLRYAGYDRRGRPAPQDLIDLPCWAEPAGRIPGRDLPEREALYIAA